MGDKFDKRRAIAKFFILFVGLNLLAGIFFYFLSSLAIDKKSFNKTIIKVPLVRKEGGRGFLDEPKIEATLKTRESPIKIRFLVDSGSTISSLPYEYSFLLGYDPINLNRIAFRGYGNSTVFAYKAQMTLMINEESMTLPVVFTENTATTPILGREGFFENYSVIFNHREKTLEIKK